MEVDREPLSMPMKNQMQVLVDLQEKIKAGLANDPTTLGIMKQAREGKTIKFWLKDGLLYFGGWLYVPKSTNLLRDLLKECHNSLWVGHPRMQWTLALLERGYY
jgi:hypothetical protein